VSDRISIVIAEDSLLVRDSVSRALATNSDLSVVGVAEDYDTAVELVEKHVPTVLVTDVRMPPTSTDEGIRLARWMRTEHPNVGVIVQVDREVIEPILRRFSPRSSDRFAALFLLEPTTGIRRGQVCGLKWASVDLDGVRSPRITTGWSWEDACAKSLAARPRMRTRRSPSTALTVTPLRAGRRSKIANARASVATTPWGLCVHLRGRASASPGHDPTAFRPPGVGRWPLPNHVPRLRHSYATAALKAGVNPKVVSDRIGYANVGFFPGDLRACPLTVLRLLLGL
jgi:CheY-like chemotaxis protein